MQPEARFRAKKIPAEAGIFAICEISPRVTQTETTTHQPFLRQRAAKPRPNRPIPARASTEGSGTRRIVPSS